MKIKKTIQSKITSVSLIVLALVLTLPVATLIARVDPVAAGSVVGVISVSPHIIELDDEIHTVAVNGTGFQEGVVVSLDGVVAASTFVSSEEISIQVPTLGITGPRDATMTIINPDESGIEVLHALTYVLPEEPVDPGDEEEFNSQVTSVEFTQQGDKQLMIIHGTDFVAGEFDALSEATDHSLVTLNGDELPFCADGFGMDAATLAAMNNMSPSLVADEPACYRLITMTEDGTTIHTTPTRAEVWLRDDFNISTPGTVSVNGSSAYAYNAQPPSDDETTPLTPTLPVVPPVQSTTILSGKIATSTPKVTVIPRQDVSNAAEDTILDEPTIERMLTVDGQSLLSTPSIEQLPTFKGKAQPYSTVVVTVHSDPVTCKATADASGDWKCRLPQALSAGSHTVRFAILSTDNVMSHFGPYPVTVAAVASDQNDATPESALQDEQKSSLPLWAIIGAAAFVAVLGLVVLGVVRRRKA